MSDKKESLGRYTILKTIGTGGMGEVLLAFDPVCKRHVAIKKIRSDLLENPIIKKRFLKEAKIASRLTHPYIVPIYSIHAAEKYIFYTMPYVEGETLKDILVETKKHPSYQNEKGSIPNLIRIFLNVCEAVAYTHSKNILHRDLKPTNIIIGKYGQVLILDWGIADFIDKATVYDNLPITIDENEDETIQITKPGKITGTVTYMAPERAFEKKASILTEVYSLGVILYQILTLSVPFNRKNLVEFRKIAGKEEFIDPIEKSPYRDIPHELSEICKKCLSPSPEDRYQNVDLLIREIKNYIEGRPKWLLNTSLDINDGSNWAIEENIFLPKHNSITNNSELSQWMRLLLAKKTVSGNIQIKAKIKFEKDSSGIGFLLSLPDLNSEFAIEEGYLLWLEMGEKPFAQLFRSNALVMESSEIKIDPGKWQKIKITKKESSFNFVLNDKLILNYKSHIPLAGTHFGIIHKDFNFEIKEFNVYSSSHSAQINCLAVPDAFLAKKDYDTAYNEYLTIANSFPGRMEGLQALFRAGIALLEKAKAKNDRSLYPQTLEEFEKLHKTAAAPLEYLGKALVYEANFEFEEEAKCLELAIRKYKDHPLIPMVKEHIIYRTYESLIKQRDAAYRLLLLTLMHIPSMKENPDTIILLKNLQKHWEKLYFIKQSKNSLIIELAYRLSKKQTLLEILNVLIKDEGKNQEDITNILLALLDLKELDILETFLSDESRRKNYYKIYLCLEIAKIKVVNSENIKIIKLQINKLFKSFSKDLTAEDLSLLIFIVRHLLDIEDNENAENIFIKKLKNYNLSPKTKKYFDYLNIWLNLSLEKYDHVKDLFNKYSEQELNIEDTLLHPLYGIYLYATENSDIALIHFSGALETPYPKTTMLLSQYLTEKIEKWFLHGFFFEKRELYRQLSLFYKCKGDTKKHKYFKDLCLQNFYDQKE